MNSHKQFVRCRAVLLSTHTHTSTQAHMHTHLSVLSSSSTHIIHISNTSTHAHTPVRAVQQFRQHQRVLGDLCTQSSSVTTCGYVYACVWVLHTYICACVCVAILHAGISVLHTCADEYHSFKQTIFFGAKKLSPLKLRFAYTYIHAGMHTFVHTHVRGAVVTRRGYINIQFHAHIRTQAHIEKIHTQTYQLFACMHTYTRGEQLTPRGLQYTVSRTHANTSTHI
jgi:hypothetical protein